jgi:adenylate cyclase
LIDVRGSRILELTDNRVVIGRSDDADLRLGEAEVSRYHAVVFREGGRTWVSDAGSVNGTSVNGATVATKPMAIGAGDELTLGPATFFFRLL